MVKLQAMSNTAFTKFFHLIPRHRKIKGQILYWIMLNQLTFRMETRQAAWLPFCNLQWADCPGQLAMH